jgi:hypothetical protein
MLMQTRLYQGLKGHSNHPKSSEANIPFSTVPLSVPSDFLGVQCGNYPAGGTSGIGVAPGTAPSNLNFSTFRLHDAYIAWYHIETSAGVYDWTRLDAWVNYYSGVRGASLMYTVYGTPAFYASDSTANDLYGHVGGASNPTSLIALGNFITALIIRYNTVTPQNPTGVKRIKFIEPWNEPRFPGEYVVHGGFWWGTATQLVDLAKTVYTATKAVDSSVVVCSPAFEKDSSLKTYLTTFATDAVNQGKTYIERVTIHPYFTVGSPYEPARSILRSNLLYESALSIRAIADIQTAAGTAFPVAYTEYGVAASPSDTELAAFLLLPVRQRYEFMYRYLAFCALSGIKSVYLYSYNSTLAGNLITDTNGVVAAYNDIASQLAGKVITSASYSSLGRITFTTNLGQTYTV